MFYNTVFHRFFLVWASENDVKIDLASCFCQKRRNDVKVNTTLRLRMNFEGWLFKSHGRFAINHEQKRYKFVIGAKKDQNMQRTRRKQKKISTICVLFIIPELNQIWLMLSKKILIPQCWYTILFDFDYTSLHCVD